MRRWLTLILLAFCIQAQAAALIIDFSLWGGGGGGAASRGGGAGAGGYVPVTNYAFTGSGPQPITVGAGGIAGTYNFGFTLPTNGGLTAFLGVTATGGGRGGNDGGAGAAGGSGGAASGAGTAGQGYPGGACNCAPSSFPQGGGGGAAETGTAGTSNIAGKGGDGVTDPLRGDIGAAGGGGGCFGAGAPCTPGPGGFGGGGAGRHGNGDSYPADDGSAPGAGGGGGGNGSNGTAFPKLNGGAGYRGQWVLRHLTADAPDGSCTSCSIFHIGNYTVYVGTVGDAWNPPTPYTPTPTVTPTHTQTSTPTITPTYTATPTATTTYTSTSTASPTPTLTITPTSSSTSTATPTRTASPTPTATRTPSCASYGDTVAEVGGPYGLPTLMGNLYALPAGRVSYVAVYVNAGGARLQAALYADSSGRPAAKTLQSAIVTASAGWNYLTVSAGTINAGNYWVLAQASTYDSRIWGRAGSHLFVQRYSDSQRHPVVFGSPPARLDATDQGIIYPNKYTFAAYAQVCDF